MSQYSFYASQLFYFLISWNFFTLEFWNYILNILTEINEIPENWQFLSPPPGLGQKAIRKKPLEKKQLEKKQLEKKQLKKQLKKTIRKK